MTRTLARSGPVRGRRDLVLAGAFVFVAGLIAQAAVFSWYGARDAKTAARVAGGAIERIELALPPREFIASESLRSFKPTRGWEDEDRPPAIAVDAEALAPYFQSTPHFELAATPLPPPRPLHLAVVHPAQRVATRHEQRSAGGGAGADIMRRLGDMGASIGKIFRVASR